MAVRSISVGEPDVVPGVALSDGATARRAATEIACAALVAISADTAAHCDDVDVIAEGICRHLGVEGKEREDVLAAARLHDIGKVAIPAEVLVKPASLDDAEWTVVRRHTVVGARIVAAVPELASVAPLVRHSHERWDGRGYPDGLAGEEIPLGARIVFCADAFHAIRTDRPYRRGRSASAALREVRAQAGTQFDPDVVAALCALAAETRLVARRPGLTKRSSRLVALLMILACGVGGSAAARSGLLGEPGPVPVAPAVAGPIAPQAASGALPAAALPFWPACGADRCAPAALGLPPPGAGPDRDAPSRRPRAERRAEAGSAAGARGTRSAGALEDGGRPAPQGSGNGFAASGDPAPPQDAPAGAGGGKPVSGNDAGKGAGSAGTAPDAGAAPAPTGGKTAPSSKDAAVAPPPPPTPDSIAPVPAEAPAPEAPSPTGGKAPEPAKGAETA